jgi:hypothetical protein
MERDSLMMPIKCFFRRVNLPISLLLVALSLPIAGHADRVLNYPALQAGLERWQADRQADAALTWSALAQSGGEGANDPDLALASVLATIAWERVGDPRAYTSWANAISGYLQAGTSWDAEREKIARKLQRNRAALLLVTPDVQPILTPEDRWLETIQTLTGLTDYNGPQPGLNGSAPQANSTVSINYFGTTPTPHGTAEVRQSSDTLRAEITEPSNGHPANIGQRYIPRADITDHSNSPVIAVTDDTQEDNTAHRLPSGPMSVVPADDITELSPTTPQLNSKNRTALSVANALQTVTPLPVQALVMPITTRISAPKKSSNSKLRPRSASVTLPTSVVQPPVSQGLATLEVSPIVLDDALQQQMAQTAWHYFENNRQPQTGMYNSKQGYAFATPWEMGHMLAGLVSAQQLGLIDRDVFLTDTQTLLATLHDLPLYDQRLPNREYSTRTGQMIDMTNQISDVGSGWSAVGLGRLMLWLELTARYYPELEEAAHAVSAGWSVADLADKGNLRGMIRNQDEQPIVEGRLGYQQYAAAGLAVQGVLIKNALSYQQIASKTIDGISVWVDPRPDSKTTSEPLYLGMMELGGIDGCFRQVADSHLKVQLAHAKRYKTSVALSEEFLAKAPWFVFNTVYAAGQDWKTSSHDGTSRPDLSSYSLKSVLAWHVIAPNGMTQWPSDLINRTSTPNGFRAGLLADGSTNTATSLATNAVVLESLWYANRAQQPFMVFSESNVAGCPIGTPSLDDTPPQDTP